MSKNNDVINLMLDKSTELFDAFARTMAKINCSQLGVLESVGVLSMYTGITMAVGGTGIELMNFIQNHSGQLTTIHEFLEHDLFASPKVGHMLIDIGLTAIAASTALMVIEATDVLKGLLYKNSKAYKDEVDKDIIQKTYRQFKMHSDPSVDRDEITEKTSLAAAFKQVVSQYRDCTGIDKSSEMQLYNQIDNNHPRP